MYFVVVFFFAEVESRTQVSRPRTQKTLARPRTKDTARKCSKKKYFAQKFSKFSRNFWRSHKKNKQIGLFPRIRKCSKISCVKNVFSQVLRRAPRRNNIAHDLDPFSTRQKMVLSSIREQGIFEWAQGQGLDHRGQGLQIVSSRPRTSSRTPLLFFCLKKAFFFEKQKLFNLIFKKEPQFTI